MIKYANVCLMYTIVYGLSSLPLGQLVRTRTTDYRSTRRALRGDYHTAQSHFSQSAFSVKAAREQNTILPTIIRDLDTYALFRVQLKNCLISTQICQHYPIIVCILFALFLIDLIVFDRLLHDLYCVIMNFSSMQRIITL